MSLQKSLLRISRQPQNPGWLALGLAVLIGAWTIQSGLDPSPNAAEPAQASNAPAVAAEPLAIGQTAPAFTFTDIRYLPRTLDDFGAPQATVIVFTKIDCPLVKRYLPRLKTLEAEFHDRGVQFLLINVGSDDPLIEVAYQSLQAELPFPTSKDFTGEAAEALGVTRTPTAVVLDATRTLRYRGRIDDQYRLGGVRPAVQQEDLRAAIEAILSNQPISKPETPVDGCLIEFQALRGLPAAVPEQVTYAEHIAPILKQHCTECHRPGTSAPFTLEDYSAARDHGEMIAEVVTQQRMPPAFASREHGHFINERKLTAKERALVAAWVRNKTPEGDPDQLSPQQPRPQQDWKIEAPDLVLQVPFAEEIPAEGYVPYRYTVLPHVFWRDTWVQQVEIRPGNAAVVHHCNMGYVTAGAKNDARNFVTGYVPGGDAMVLNSGVGFKIPAGSMLGLQIHYVTTGTKTTDRISVGLRFAREPIQKQLRHLQITAHGFEIPAGAPHFPLSARRTIPQAATGIGMFAHMHLRGKDMIFRALSPEKEPETLLAIPNYNFDWQIPYRWAPDTRKFPAGTQIECVAHYDNSAFNPYNPDPKNPVREGQQTYQEMMYGFMFFTYDDEALGLQIDPRTGYVLNSPEKNSKAE